MNKLNEFTPRLAHVVVHLRANLLDTIAKLVEPHRARHFDGEDFVLIVGGAGVFANVGAHNFTPLALQLPALKTGRKR